MRANKKNISSLHDVRPPATFETKQPAASFVSQRNTSGFEEQSDRFEVRVSGTPIEEVTLRPKDSTIFLSQLTKRNKLSRNTLIKKRKMRGRLRSLFLATAMLAIVLYGLSLYNLRDNAFGTLSSVQNNLTNAVNALRNFNNDEAGLSLSNAATGLDALGGELKQHGLFGLSTLLGVVFPVAQNAKLTYENFNVTLSSAIELNNDVVTLKDSGLSYFMNGRGDKLTAILKSMRNNLKQVITSGETLQKLSASLSSSFLNKYINLPNIGSDLTFFKEGYDAEGFIDALIASLNSETPAHLLLLFQNPSEMRPSGGFLGSYAALTIKDGALQNFDVRDIYDPDGWVEKKIIPPKPLQVMTTDWEARDANWFLDYRLSAQKVIGRLEDSLFYKEKGVTFMGAIAINTTVIEDLIGLTGSIELPQYNLVITKENFLDKVQYEVEAGRNKANNQPKKILSDITPKLLERLSGLNAQQKNELFDLLKKHLFAKDIQIYFKEKSLEQFMEKYGIAGASFELPENWVGDYLAVVNANVAGGKTDAYIDQRVKVVSSLDISGKAINIVTVERSHKGGKTAYFWYNVTNKDYLRILTPPSTSLNEIKGGTARVMNPPINFGAKGYVSDPDISLLEGSSTESGKNVFASWLYTNPRTTSTITFSYERPLAIKLKNGTTYQFVFDKQSGVRSSLEYTIEAPPGFRWKESKNTIFNYTSEDPPARVVLDLTLEEI